MGNDLREIIRQIKNQADIVEVIGRRVALKRAGTRYKGCCPFHEEKTPSFTVTPSRGMFHCFGCGVGGSVIDFLMKADRLEFMEAVERLADELDIELPRTGFATPEDRKQRQDLQQRLYTANEAALAWFRDNLLKERYPPANAYLPERGIEPELSERFLLGAAPKSWDSLKKHLLRLGFEESTLVDAGLCVRSERGRVYDRFRDRLIFPIRDTNGKTAGFGGRLLSKEEGVAKYFNSAETEIYKKSRILYALDIAQKEILQSGYAILCEGYMDVLMAHAHGFRQAVASLGTALTEDQARLLKRFTQKAFFLYDGDPAGVKAMLKGGEPLLRAGFDVRVILLPEEDDPDTFLRREGPDALRKKMDGADEFFDFALQRHAESLDLRTLAGQAELVERLGPVLLSFTNEVMREGAIARLLRRLGNLPRVALDQILEQKSKQDRRAEKRDSEKEETPQQPTPAGPHAPAYDALERNLLKIMLESAEALEIIRAGLHYDWVNDERLQMWIFYFYDHHDYVQTLIDEMEAEGDYPGDYRILTSVLAWDSPMGEPEEAAKELLRRLQERYQLGLTRKWLSMIDEKILEGEDAARILAAYHHEHQTRLKQSGRYLRTKDFATRSGRSALS